MSRLLAVSLLAFTACAQVETQSVVDPEPAPAEPAWYALYADFGPDDYPKFVGIGLVDPKWAEHVTDVLHEHEIPNLVEGSVAYGIAVAPGFEQRALTVLRADVEIHGYWAELDDGSRGRREVLRTRRHAFEFAPHPPNPAPLARPWPGRAA